MSQKSAMKSSQPAVKAKELVSVTLLQERGQYTRLDVGPFAIAAVVLASASFHLYKEGIPLITNWPLFGLGAVAISWILVLLFTHWSVRVRAFVTCIPTLDLSRAAFVKVVPAKFAGKKEILPLQKRWLQKDSPSDSYEVSFEFRKHKFIYNLESSTFEKLKYPVKETFDAYSKSSGYGTMTKLQAALDKWGLNKFEVPVPPFLELMKEQMLAPFFVFQVFCVALWCIDEYWYYSIFTLFMLITFEATVVGQRQRNLRELHSLQTPKQNLNVYRNGKWDAIPGEDLLPGDLISVVRPSGPKSEEVVVPADCLLLAGSCIVEEAVLTGESTPQWKVPITDCEPAARLNIKTDKHNCLFGGTKVLQHTGDKNSRIRTPDGGCLAVVLRTGFETAQGQLMRTILYSTERVTANNVETGLFILFLLFFAVSAAYYVLVNGLKDKSRSGFKLVLNCIMIITSVIPPELPMELSIAVNTSLVMLAKKRVFCTEPFRIPFAGKVDVCCFDKTGTLTSDHLLLEGVAGVEGQKDEMLTEMKNAPSRVGLVLACCQALVQVEQQMVGDPLEKASLESSQWSYSNDVAVSPDRKLKGMILHRFHFSSTLKRMSAVVRVEREDSNERTNEVVLKGAPEVIRSFLKHVPEDYDRVYKSYAAQGARVIALAHKTLPDTDASQIRSLTRDAVENGVDFVGFAIFQCPLKDGSEPALAALRESCHQLMMITGDAPLTACYAASKVHIVTREVLILLHREDRIGGNDSAVRKEGDSEYVWMSPDEAVVKPFSREWGDMLLLAADYDLCMSGDALAYLEAISVATSIIPLCQVYARVSPEQKELVVKTLRAAGRVTLMCGDGTNDVGGLKAAHVGVALLSSVEQNKKDKDAKKKKERGATNSEASTAVEVVQKKPKGPAKKTRGQQMLEEWEKKGRPITPQVRNLAQSLDRLEEQMGGMDAGEPPLLKPGDASMASPFTARASDVMPCTDIIKQGRCTLVTTVQMFKILGLLCLSTAYSLSVMYLQGVKLSDVQATTSGLLTAGMFFFISSAKPLDKLSAERPHPNIFNPYFFLSLMGQFTCHLSLLVYMYHMALAQMPQEERQGTDTEFKPNLVNTVCYLVGAAVQLMTFAVNYVGHPFNTSLTENKGLYTCLFYSMLFLIAVASDVGGIASSFGLVSIPTEMRYTMFALICAAFLITYQWEQLLRNMLKAKAPREKGYMEHEAELKRLQSSLKKEL